MNIKTISSRQADALLNIGHPRHVEEFLYHNSPNIRLFAADQCKDKHKAANALIKDYYPSIRAWVAEHGNENHRRALHNDPSPMVRSAVATSTREPDLLQKLSCDPNPTVAELAQRTMDFLKSKTYKRLQEKHYGD